MKFPRRQFLHLAAGAAALPTVSRIARAQTYPARPVRLLVGFPPGGGADAASRIIAARLSEIWGQPVVVENRSGSGGNTANDAAAHAAPDGYTILLTTGAPAIHGFLLGTLTYDPMNDLSPVSMVGSYPGILAVSNSSPIRSVSDYIAYAKANPGKVTYSSPGVGTTGHLSGELFKRKAGIELTHVPYRTGSMIDLMAGRVDAMFNTSGTLLQPVRSGQVRGLGVTSGRRYDMAPELPAIAETVPDFEVTSWYGLYVPGKTPGSIVQKMNADVVAMLSDDGMRAKFEPLGVSVTSSTPAELAAKARADADLLGPIIKQASIRGQ
jgi:tripartite-type tricarboxylate transporter receptor subunit TctC